jgi:hypothetical protein
LNNEEGCIQYFTAGKSPPLQHRTYTSKATYLSEMVGGNDVVVRYHPRTIIQLLSVYTYNLQSGQLSHALEQEERIAQTAFVVFMIQILHIATISLYAVSNLGEPSSVKETCRVECCFLSL